jgi:hypothetical protein
MKSKNRSSSRRRKRSKSRGRSPPCIRKAKKEVRCLALVGGRQCCRKVAIDCVDYCYQHAQKTNSYCSPIRNYRRKRSRSPVNYSYREASPVNYRKASPVNYPYRKASPVNYPYRKASPVNYRKASPVNYREASLEFIPLPNPNDLDRERQRSRDRMKDVMVELKQKTGVLYRYLKKQKILGIDIIDDIQSVKEFPYSENAMSKFTSGLVQLTEQEIMDLLEDSYVVLGHKIYDEQFIEQARKFCKDRLQNDKMTNYFCELAVGVVKNDNTFLNYTLYTLAQVSANLTVIGASYLVIQYLYFGGVDFKTIFSLIPSITFQEAFQKTLATISALPEIATAMMSYLFSFAPLTLLKELFRNKEISAFFENLANGENSARQFWLAGGLPEQFKQLVNAARIQLNIGEYPSILPPPDIPYVETPALVSTAVAIRPGTAVALYNQAAQPIINNIQSTAVAIRPGTAVALYNKAARAINGELPLYYDPAYIDQVPYSSTPVTDGIMEKVVSSPVILQLLKVLGLGVSGLAVAYAIMSIYRYLATPQQARNQDQLPPVRRFSEEQARVQGLSQQEYKEEKEQDDEKKNS